VFPTRYELDKWGAGYAGRFGCPKPDDPNRQDRVDSGSSRTSMKAAVLTGRRLFVSCSDDPEHTSGIQGARRYRSVITIWLRDGSAALVRGRGA
jgi:hypothetical protein